MPSPCDRPALDWASPIYVSWALVGVVVLAHLATGLSWWLGEEGGIRKSFFVARDVRFRALAGGQYRVLVEQGQLWRLATSVLLHGDALHLAVNAVALLALGRLVEPLVGGLRFATWFTLGGVGGSVLSHLVGVEQSDGASGGAFALLGAAVVLGWRYRAVLDDEDRRLLVPVLGGFLLLNLGLSFVLPFVDAAGHLGGLAVGLVVGAIATLDGSARRRRWMGWLEGTWLIAFTLACAVGWATA